MNQKKKTKNCSCSFQGLQDATNHTKKQNGNRTKSNVIYKNEMEQCLKMCKPRTNKRIRDIQCSAIINKMDDVMPKAMPKPLTDKRNKNIQYASISITGNCKFVGRNSNVIYKNEMKYHILKNST